ncbi:hypothetical protein CPB84DRAFT_1680513, partial [Gymnopilus junonius]
SMSTPNATRLPDPNNRVPTVNDLRVKLCYICREEESAEDPQQGPARAWTHPCSCTLIAHEQCLLKWIQASQGSTARAPNALKCPQCGTQYEMTSNEPMLLRVLAAGNKILQKLGRYFTVFAAAATVGVVGKSVYICLTGYGAWALEKFIGKELYNLILTDDPVNWPWSAFINLPLLPISLILSRFQSTPASHSLLIPLLIVWPPSPPVGAQSKKIYEYWLKPENAQRLSTIPFFPPVYWPPPPVLFGLVGMPFVRVCYRLMYARLYKRVLGTPLPPQNNQIPRGGLRFDEGPFVIRIRANADDEQQQGQAQGNGQQQANNDDNNANGIPAPNNVQPNPLADQDPNPNPNAEVVEAAEQLIEINAASLGRRVGGALLIPAISSMMGELLYRLSRHSRILRVFLGIRGQRLGGSGSVLDSAAFWAVLAREDVEGYGAMAAFYDGTEGRVDGVPGGSRTWMDAEPVWWRNCVGFGLFVAAKDCLQLLHLWLAKRELESRKVKDRDFAGVDIRELDLLPSFFQRRR